MIDWPLEDRLKIIKNFKPIDKPSFDNGEEDAFRYVVWNIYSRICDAIKSFIILYENNCFYDAYTVAGYILETCSLLCYVRSEKTEVENRNNYNKYLASITMKQIIENLEDTNNLDTELDWLSFSTNLKIFYQVGKTILKEGKNYEDIIKLINYRKGPNEEKIGLFRKNFSMLTTNNYINCLSDAVDNIDDGRFSFYYKKYCSLKHNNLINVGSLLKNEFLNNEKSDMLYLVLGIITYLDKYFKFK